MTVLGVESVLGLF